MNFRSRTNVKRAYAWPIIAAGGASCVYACSQLARNSDDLPLLLLAIFTSISLDRAAEQFPRICSNLPLSRTLIFLTILLFDPASAVLVAAADGLWLSFKISKNKLVVAFHTALKALCALMMAAAIPFGIGELGNTFVKGSLVSAMIVVSLTGVAERFIYSRLLIGPQAFKADPGFRSARAWLPRFDPVLDFLSAPLAVSLAIVIGPTGYVALIAVTPVLSIIAFVFFGHLVILKQAEASTFEAEEAKRSLAQLQESEELFRSAFDHAPIGMGLVAQDGRWLQVNAALSEILGYSEQELLEMDFQSVTNARDLYNFSCHFSEVANGKCPRQQVEKRYTHKLGHDVWVTVNISLAPDSQAGSPHVILQIQDITQRKHVERRLVHEASHDSLTGLPNRAYLMEQLNASFKRAKRYKNELFAVLFLDLDRFKVINDSIGHMVGDRLLVGIAERLRNCMRPGDQVARLGGDEFTILLRKLKTVGEAAQVADRIQKEVAVPFGLGNHEAFTTASIGIAVYDSSYEQPEELLRDADTAMYHAKANGKARHSLFHKGMHAHAMNLLWLETDMRRAIERGEFFVEYQPIVSLRSATLTGFEALVRWQHPDRGAIYPERFIGAAEEAGYIIPIGQWVLQEACNQMKTWQRQFAGDLPLSISVNLSGKQIINSNLTDQVVQILDATGIDPRALKLEITETAVMENIEIVSEMLLQLRAYGIELSMDDFGTGYSSLSYLHRLPINALKIDRSFVNRIGENKDNSEIVRTIIMLAQNLGMGVVAEGVETREQLGLLKELNCESAQGYLFSRPLSATSAEKLIRRALDFRTSPSRAARDNSKHGPHEVQNIYPAALPLFTALAS